MFAVSTGKLDITPGAGYPMAGFAVDSPRLSTGVNEPLMARCTVIWDGVTPYVIVTADVLGFRAALHSQIRMRVMALGVAASSFVLTATHTHNGPVLLEGLDPFIAYGLEDLDDVSAFTDGLADDIVSLVSDTLVTPRTNCSLEYTVLNEDFSMNREGLPYDETDVPVLVARATDGTPRAVLFSYAAHPVAANGQLSFDPDYPAQAIKEIEAAWPESFAQFLLGPAGDQNPTVQGGFEEADELGRRLGDTVVAGLNFPCQSLASPILAASANVPLPLDISCTPENIALVGAFFSARSADPHALGFVRRHAARMVDLIESTPIEELETTIDVPVQRWRFSGVDGLTILFSGGEVVSGFAVALRYQFGGSKRFWFLGYSNEVPGYIPTDELLDHACYAGGIDGDYPGIAGGSMTVYAHLAHFRMTGNSRSADGVEKSYLAHVRALL